MSRGRNFQSARQIVVLRILQAAGKRGLSPLELLEKLTDRGYSVTKRTVYRDIEGLQAAGYPIAESGSKSDKGGIRLKYDAETDGSRDQTVATLAVSQKQLAGLYLAKSYFKSLASSELFEGLDHFFEQVSDFIGSQNRKRLDEFARDFHIAPAEIVPQSAGSEVIETIRAAIGEGQCLGVKYQSSNSGTHRARVLGPHYLYMLDGGLYLVAEDMEDHKIKTFAVPRMSDSKLMDRDYTGHKTKPEDFFGNSFGAWRASEAHEVHVRFSARTAAFIAERTWHKSQKISHHKDGSITLVMNVGITPQLVGWILSFTDSAAVERPSSLRDEVRMAADAVAGLYTRKAG